MDAGNGGGSPRASVRAARQYCGALGKRADCQVAVSVQAATDRVSGPLGWELFLPEKWAHDTQRRTAAGVSDEVGHGTWAARAASVPIKETGPSDGEQDKPT